MPSLSDLQYIEMWLHTTNTTPQKKHQHHNLPCPLASSSFNFTGECNCHMLWNRSRSPQHCDVIFIDETNIFLFYWLLFFRPQTGMLANQRWFFLVITFILFLAVASKQRAPTPTICWFFSADVLLVLVVFCHDFVLGGGDAMVAMFTLLQHR